MDIGDIREIYQVDDRDGETVVDSWELKALVQYEYFYDLLTWCESPSWNLDENPYTVEPKLNTYLWGQFKYNDEKWN